MNNEPNIQSCRMQVMQGSPCLESCKLTRFKNKSIFEYNCLAITKFSDYLKSNENDIQISLSAFYSAPKEVINEFLRQNPENKKLLKLYFNLGDVKKCADRANHLSESILVDLLNDAWNTFHRKKPSKDILNEFESFFNLRVNAFWKYVSKEKLKSIKQYSLKTDINSYVENLIAYLIELTSPAPDPIEMTGSDENNFHLYLLLLEEMQNLIKAHPEINKNFSEDYRNHSIVNDLSFAKSSDLNRIEKLNEIIDRISLNYNEDNLKSNIYVLQKLRTEIDLLNSNSITSEVFIDTLTSGNFVSISQYLNFFKLQPPETIISNYNQNKDNPDFIENFIYFCWLFRYEESIHNLFNCDLFPDELLIQIIYFNYGKWILNGNEAEDYFSNFTLFVNAGKCKQLLAETDIIRMDLNFALCLFSNLDIENLEIFFKEVRNKENTIQMFCSIFMNLDTSKMETFFIKNPHLFNHFLKYMSHYPENKIIIDFFKTYEKNLKFIDSIYVKAEDIRIRFNYENEYLLIPNDPERIWFIVNEMSGLDNIDLILNVFENKNIFLNTQEKQLVLDLYKNPYLKNSILDKITIPKDLNQYPLKNSDLLTNIYKT
ncbi:MAG: hypothetical protein H7A24_03805 [Leptospiraceae bacterium]|nr:hypothetical protein [Leptospiraceae bacterium]MCP5510977.1 hypothetical protein [Leptospiraceae bacterium]